jgi:hypothetical protein
MTLPKIITDQLNKKKINNNRIDLDFKPIKMSDITVDNLSELSKAINNTTFVVCLNFCENQLGDLVSNKWDAFFQHLDKLEITCYICIEKLQANHFVELQQQSMTAPGGIMVHYNGEKSLEMTKYPSWAETKQGLTHLQQKTQSTIYNNTNLSWNSNNNSQTTSTVTNSVSSSGTNISTTTTTSSTASSASTPVSNITLSTT